MIDGFRKGDPNIRARIPDPYSRTAVEGEEVGAFPTKGTKLSVGSQVTTSLPLPPLDLTRQSNLTKAPFYVMVDTFCVKKLKIE